MAPWPAPLPVILAERRSSLSVRSLTRQRLFLFDNWNSIGPRQMRKNFVQLYFTMDDLVSESAINPLACGPYPSLNPACLPRYKSLFSLQLALFVVQVLIYTYSYGIIRTNRTTRQTNPSDIVPKQWRKSIPDFSGICQSFLSNSGGLAAA